VKTKEQEPQKNETKSFSSFFERSWHWFVIALNLSITLPLSYVLNIWLDEAYTLETTEHGIKHAFNQAIYFEFQPPLYFLLLTVWRKLNGSIFFARLFSVICIALMIYVMAVFTRKLFRDYKAFCFTLIIALNPFVIWSASDIRVYAFALLLTALLLVYFYEGFLKDENENLKAQIIYALVALACLYTQYYVGFLLVSNAFALLVLRRWRMLWRYLVCMACVGILFAPMMVLVFLQIFSHTKGFESRDTFIQSSANYFWILKDYVIPAVPTEGNLAFARSWLLRIVYLALIVLGIKNRRCLLNENKITLWASAAFLSATFFVLHYKLGAILMSSRHSFALFLILNLAVFVLIATVAYKQGVLIWTLLVAVFSVFSLFGIYESMAKSGDWIRVANFLKAEEKQDQPILIFLPSDELALKRYYAGQNSFVPLPVRDDLKTYDLGLFVLKDETQIIKAIENAKADKEKVWLINDGICKFGVNFNCALLESFVEKYYLIEQEKRFYGARVRLLKRKKHLGQ